MAQPVVCDCAASPVRSPNFSHADVRSRGTADLAWPIAPNLRLTHRTEGDAMLRRHTARVSAGGEAEDVGRIAAEEVDMLLRQRFQHIRLSAFHSQQRPLDVRATHGVLAEMAIAQHDTMAGDRERALAAGCDDYDAKPVVFERLLAKIRALLQCRSSS